MARRFGLIALSTKTVEMWSRPSPSSMPETNIDQKVVDAMRLLSETPVSVLKKANTKLLESTYAHVALASHDDPIPEAIAKFEPLPPGPFAVIVMAPPWAKRGRSLTKTTLPKHLSIHDLVHLNPVQSMATDAVLCVWASDLRVPDAYLLGAVWGLTFAGIMFVNVTIDTKTHVPILKTGVFTKSSADFMLVFTRGNPHFTISDNTLSQIIFARDTDPTDIASVADLGETLTMQESTRTGPQTRYRAASGILFHPSSEGKNCHPIADDFMDRIFRNMPKLQVFAEKPRDGWVGYGTPVAEGQHDLVDLIRQSEKANATYHTKRQERQSKRKRKRLGHTSIDEDDSVPMQIRYRTRPGPKPKKKKRKKQ